MGKRPQRDKAFYSNKKIWFIMVYKKEEDKTEMEIIKEGKWVSVYVVDDSMGRAIKKAVHYFGRITGIKTLKIEEYFKTELLRITVRRATKMEISNVRAGMGLKIADHYKQDSLEVI